MNRRTILATGGGLVLLLGCSGLLGPDPAAIAELERALAVVDPEQAVDLFLQGSVEAGSVRFGCATAVEAAVAFDDPAMRATLFARAFGERTSMCPALCAGDLDALPVLESGPLVDLVVTRCDLDGPDPVFGGPVADLRRSMAVLDYLVVRALAEVAVDAVPSFAAVHPKLAVGMVLANAPQEVEPTPSLSVVSSREVGDVEFEELGAAVVACGPDAAVAHRVVFGPEGGVVGVAGPTGPCVVEALQALVLPPSDGYAVLDLAWKPGPAATPSPAPSAAPSPALPAAPSPAPRGGGGAPTVVGSLPAQAVKRVLGAQAGKVRFCYERQLAENPQLAGDLAVRIVIGRDGTVSSAEVVSSSLGSPALEACIEEQIRRVTFPGSSGDGAVTVTWPISFAPAR